MNYQTIRPSGILDGIAANQIRCDISDGITEGMTVILLDLQDVTFMNSSAIGVLVASLKLVQAAGGEFGLCALHDQIRIIFELTKMDRIFKIYPDPKAFEKAMMTIA